MAGSNDGGLSQQGDDAEDNSETDEGKDGTAVGNTEMGENNSVVAERKWRPTSTDVTAAHGQIAGDSEECEHGRCESRRVASMGDVERASRERRRICRERTRRMSPGSWEKAAGLVESPTGERKSPARFRQCLSRWR